MSNWIDMQSKISLVLQASGDVYMFARCIL